MIGAWLEPIVQWLGVGTLTTLLLLVIAVVSLIRLIKGD